MSFANPLLLLGLLAAAVPIIIHLINRRRPRKLPFPAMELLLRSAQRVERRLRLRRILLLSLRVLLLAALALAAAGPLIGEERARVVSRVLGPERVAFVIDASLSMRARYDGRSAFARALAEARERVDQLGPEDRALIVVTGSPPRLPIERPTGDRGRLLGVLAELEPGWQPASVSEAVSVAAEALGRPDGEAPMEGAPIEGADDAQPRARVVVFSDLARPAIDAAASLEVPSASAPATLEVIDLMADISAELRRNHGFVSVVPEPIPGEVPRTVDLLARIQSHATRTQDDPEPRSITLRQGTATLEQGLVEIAPGALTQKTVRHAFDQAGAQPCALELEADTLAEDDVHYLQVEVRKQTRALVVNGDPSGVAKEDEVFYLERALEAGASDQPPPRVVTADDLPRTDLTPFDVVVLAGVPTLSRAEGERLVRFVEGGGGLLLTAAEGMDLEAYEAGLGPVLPRRLRGLKRSEEGKPLSLTAPTVDHPISRLFVGEALGGLLTTETTGLLLLEPGGRREMATVLAFDGGAPALVVAEAGKGRVAVLTTSIDRDLTDLPIRPAFVPLVRQLLLWLGDALSEPDRRTTWVGERRELVVPAEATRLEITGPDGRTHRFGLGDMEGGRVQFADTDRPGHYEARLAFGGDLEPYGRLSFAVNVNPVESDLRPWSATEAAAILRGEAAAEVGTTIASTRSALARRLDSEGLAGLLLGLMGLAFLLESALTALRPGR